ncbi:MBL fold metallo-hydrolase [Candidatus Aerophobetes bacterium]|nr:MBL fold metallo-hydrolase [Candidatus Aerophobetes bacterium]
MKKDYFYFSPCFWKKNPLVSGGLKVYLVWFDSMGAKSSSLLVETPDLRILVDPGAAAMQPSYPLPDEKKAKLRKVALRFIKKAAKKADIVFISHYHYDHHTLPGEAKEIYQNKTLWIKNPNLFINLSQFERARLFLRELLGKRFDKVLSSPPFFSPEDPLEHLPLARKKDWGAYTKRKEELILKGRRWFEKVVEKWREGPFIDEEKAKKYKIYFADGNFFQIGGTRVRFTRPLFHGVEYDRVGWVVGLVVEFNEKRFIYTSDIQGPAIEDYAVWIIKENPSILVIDGPPTYLLGYMLNYINFERCIENFVNILKNTSTEVIIYDHHLLREKGYLRKMERIYREVAGEGKKVLTAAEWYNKIPLVLQI